MQKGQEISEEDASCEDVAIAREDFHQDLIDEAQKQINLQHPLICDNVNLGRIQNMDPGPWTTPVDPVHGPPQGPGPWTPYFSDQKKRKQ